MLFKVLEPKENINRIITSKTIKNIPILKKISEFLMDITRNTEFSRGLVVSKIYNPKKAIAF